MQTLHTKATKAANILDLMRHLELDMPTLEAFSLACDLETEAQADTDCLGLTALEFLNCEYDLWKDGESEYSEHLLDSVKELLTDPEAYSFIRLYCEERFGNN